jgi:hypothetical protein
MAFWRTATGAAASPEGDSSPSRKARMMRRSVRVMARRFTWAATQSTSWATCQRGKEGHARTVADQGDLVSFKDIADGDVNNGFTFFRIGQVQRARTGWPRGVGSGPNPTA